MRIQLDPNTAIRQFKNIRRKTVAVFKCAAATCLNEIQMHPYPSVLKRATGYCTSCLQKKKPYGVIYRKLVRSAIHKGVECQLSYDEFLKFTKINNCEYCNRVIEWTEYTTSKDTGSYPYNIDRKDSSLGYIKDNCVVSCGRCNQVKNSLFTYDEFKLIGKVIAQIDRNRT